MTSQHNSKLRNIPQNWSHIVTRKGNSLVTHEIGCQLAHTVWKNVIWCNSHLVEHVTPLHHANLNSNRRFGFLKFQYENDNISYSTFTSLILAPLRRLFIYLSFIQHKYNNKSILHTPSVNIVKSHSVCFSSIRMIAYVTKPLRSLVIFQCAL